MEKTYWMDKLKDIYSFMNFLKDIDSYKTFDKVSYDFSNGTGDFEKFLIKQNISFFEFYTSIISLYLSRISNSNGIIFSYSNITPEDTLFKIKYDDKISILDFIISVKNAINNALDNSMENLKNYVKDLDSDYCDYIFNYTIVNQTNENHIKNNINSSIIFKISEESIEVEYDINTFSRFEIEAMLENIEAILYNCLNDMNQHCGDVNILCNRQLNLLNDFSKGEDFKLDDKLIPEIILEMAEKYPDNFAINDEINRITYKELVDLIPSLTYTLQHVYKIGKSDKIVLYLPRSYHVPLLTVCLMKLGAVTIPVDDSYPKDYIQSIINNSSPKYIIHELDYDFADVESIHLNDIKNNETANLMDVDVNLDDTALILYTSGSTGVPKGVEVTQRNIININSNYFNHSDVPEGGMGNRMVLAKFTFVASLPIYGSLMYGLEAFIIRETTKKSIAKIVKYLKTYHCYSMSATQELGLYLYNNFDLKLDNLSLAGSNLLKSDIRDDSSTVLWNAYGCTETSGSVIINKVNNDLSDFSVIGKPLGNSRVYILDANKKQLPIGAIGELVIGGPVVTKQYFNNPEQTNKAYGEFNGERVYFTNDLAYFKPDGNIVYVGRKDDLINLNGFRIEPKGVESTISEYSDFNQIKVVVGKVNRQNHLIAYYSSDVDIDEDDLNEYLSVHLPSYMVPSFYVRMNHLPLNPNGKIDVKCLPPVELDEVDFAKPRNELEEIVVNIFEKFFNQENISVYDNFIQLGGTSIIAMKIVKELDDYNLSVNDLISLGTPEKIAEHIQNNTVMDLDMGRYSLEEGCPLNESQMNVFLDIIRYEKNDVYNIPLTINIPGTYSADDLKSALFEMFNVHSILKSFINLVDGNPFLKTGFNPTVDYLNEYVDDVISDFMNKSFDIYSSLSRFLLVKKDDGDFVLVGVFHHLIFDGFSSLVFKQHLFDLLDGKVLKLDEGFVKSSVYNKKIVNTAEYSDAEAFYESMLCEAADVSSFLSDVGDNKAGFYSLDLSVDKYDIEVLLKSLGVSENILFTGVFAYTLSRFTGDNKVLFNVLDNGRDKLSNYESIGMYVNTLPLLVDCSDKDLASFIEDIRDLIFNVFSYNFYPFRVLAQKFNINSSILFQYLPIFDEVNNQFFNVSDFEFRIFEKNNRYVVNVIYSGAFSSDTIKRFVESYNMILNQLLSVDKLSDINYISSSDLELLNTYNDTSCDLGHVDILDAFNDNLSRYPDNMLVSYEDRFYTYAEGAFIADKIAYSLKGLGVEMRDKVAFLVEKSELYMFCVLGILSVGAIYVPLDDAHPDDRIQFILEDTDSKVVIVSDKTYERAKSLTNDSIILNISDVMKEDVGTADKLPVVYNDLGCILYTSGTTGLPKGVKVPRIAFVNLSAYYIRNYGFIKDDVFGLYSSIGFDAAYKAVFAAVYAGACLDVIPSDVKLDMDSLNNHFIKQGINHADLPTQVAKLLISQVDDVPFDVLFTVGEKLGDFDEEVDCRFVDAYGPTEAYVEVSTGDVADRIDSSSIGHLVDNIKAYILDDEFRRVPVGAVGELYLAGNQIADGYLNRDEETTKAFLNNPFDDDEDYSVLYRTGDLVRVLSDGSLGIVGRRDSQVKIRGNRVELSEIGAVIREIDFVEDLTVQTIKNGTNNELVAYVVVSDEFDGDLKEEISDYVDERKPEYMIPSFVVELDEIPLNVNGKVDKRALPEVDVEGLQVEYVAPTTETEKQIVEAFENVFNQENIGIYDDFVRLGGDSITAIKVISILSKYDININARVIFDNKTPYQIAKFIDEDQPEYGFYLAKEGTSDQNMFLLPPVEGISTVFTQLVDNIEFEGNVYLIDDFKFDLTVDEIKNTDHNMTFEKYYDAIKDIFRDEDIIVGYSLGCLFAMMIVEKLEKDRKVEKCVLIDGPLEFFCDDVPDKDEALAFINELYGLGVDVDGLRSEDHNELIDKIVEIFTINSIWDFPAAKINDTQVIYLASDNEYEGRLEDIARNGEFIVIEDTNHSSIVTNDVKKIIRYLK